MRGGNGRPSSFPVLRAMPCVSTSIGKNLCTHRRQPRPTPPCLASSARPDSARGCLLLDCAQVAEVCVAALVEPSAANKVVEVIAEQGAPAKSLAELFAGVTW